MTKTQITLLKITQIMHAPYRFLENRQDLNKVHAIDISHMPIKHTHCPT